MLIFLYEVHMFNFDAIIIQKLGFFSSPKIIIIIATSLTSNNFIDAHKWLRNNNKKKTNM